MKEPTALSTLQSCGESPIPFVDLQRQTHLLAAEMQTAMWNVCAAGDFILGGETERFESAFAQFTGVKAAVGVASGLDALKLSLQALDIGPGDEVIVPANTFIATALAVTGVGARPVLVDCELGTRNLDPALVRAAITPRTRAILPVHLAGLPANLAAISELAMPRGIAVIEDACQAHGAVYRGERCGAWGTSGCFSFYPGKNLGAFGDGGLVTTNDLAIAQRIRRLRNYGQEVKYRHVEQGCNSRLDTLQAAILNVKLRRLDAWNAARAEHAAAYRRLLSGVGDLQLPAGPRNGTHVYHLFVIETGQRDALQRHLANSGIQTGIHYPVPIHLQPAYASLGYVLGDFPVAESQAERVLSLPMFPELTSDEIARVTTVIRTFFARTVRAEGNGSRRRAEHGASSR